MVQPQPTAPIGAEPATCYRHRSNAAPVRCRRCERPICTECMVSAPVGWQCRDCVQGAGTRVYTRETMHLAGGTPVVTAVLIGLNVIAFLLTLGVGSTRLFQDYALQGDLVAAGEWWRLLTGGFLHDGIIHIGFNLLILWRLGQSLEPRFGPLRFAGVYALSLAGGSLGALVLSPHVFTVGASGAVFGLMGCALVHRRALAHDPMVASVGGLIVVNLVISVALPGISLGGHVGGLVAGAVAGLVLRVLDGDRAKALAGAGALLALAAAVVAATYVAAPDLVARSLS